MIKTLPTLESPFFSIVIPSLNEEKFLPLLLEDLKKQTFKNFEVIHVDGNSEDETRSLAALFSSDIALQTLCVARRNVSFQRNTGAASARGSWIIFMDADNRLKKTFLAQLSTKLAEHPEIDLFTCYMDSTGASLFNKHLIDLSNFMIEAMAKVRPCAAGALIGIRRHKLGKLEFNCTARMSEDHQFVEEAVKAGCQYQVFRQPRFGYSMRRFEKEGSLKIIASYIQGAAVLLAGPRFERFLPKYQMNGGTTYTETAHLRGFLPSMKEMIRRTSAEQQKKVKKLILNLQNLINEL